MIQLQDYQKPYFTEYIEMCHEIEKIPAHEQQTKVIVAFHEFYKKMRDDLVELQSTIEINDDFIHNKYGYCYYEIEPGKNPIVFNLYVHPQYRKQGHAKKILQYVINEIRQAGYLGQIDIEAAPRENSIEYEKLASFYENMGLHLMERSK
jgi:GNAT superfamily N-acetyltransferase